jgi:hypothetical protein
MVEAIVGSSVFEIRPQNVRAREATIRPAEGAGAVQKSDIAAAAAPG